MKVQEFSALCFRQMKLLREENEIEEAVAIMNVSLMQAAHSSEQRKMSESLDNRCQEIMALNCVMEGGHGRKRRT